MTNRYKTVDFDISDPAKLSNEGLLITMNGHKVSYIRDCKYNGSDSLLFLVKIDYSDSEIPVIYNKNGVPLNLDYMGILSKDYSLLEDTWNTKWVNVSYDYTSDPVFSKTYNSYMDAYTHKVPSDKHTIKINYPNKI